jgi:HlyD family secretion protein
MIAFLRRPRVLVATLVVLLLLAVALWPGTTLVDVAPVARGPLQVTVDEEGETRVRERFVITAPAAGRVARIELEPGDRVARGKTVLATIRPAPLDVRARAEAAAALEAAEANAGRARAERERAEQALRLARSELLRHRTLFAQGVVSQQALEAQEVAVRQSEEAQRAAAFAAAAAEHEREMAAARLQPSADGGAKPIEIVSPVDGAVLKRYRESDGVVAAAEPLLEVGQPGDLEIVSDLLSTDAVRVRPGQPARVEQWGGEEPLSGRVRRVEPSGFMKVSALGVEEQRVNVILDLDGPPEARASLGDGYRVEVRIVVWEREGVVKVPTSALFRRGERWAVFAKDGGRARLRELEIGQRNALEAEVLGGIDPAAQVIVHPSDSLADGARVRTRD